MTTDANIATRLARQLWGEINQQIKIMKGAWYFSCSRHGGYIVDTNIHPQFVFKEREVANRNWIIAGEQHFAALEEDVDWMYFEICYARLVHREGQDLEKLEHELSDWNPNWVKTFKEKLNSSEALELSKMLYDRNYVDPIAVSAGLLTLYEMNVGKDITEIEPHTRLRLRDNCFVFFKGMLPSKPVLAFG